MRLDIRSFLHDIQQACDFIARFTTGKTLDDYLSDPFLRSAVERQFTIIGEALNRAVRLDPRLYDRISDVQRIIDFRHVLVHGYAAVEDEVVWGVVQANLPVLYREVAELLAREG